MHSKNRNVFANRYRIRSARMPKWDYAYTGRYFVTICTRDRVPWFGEVREQTMHLSPLGVIVHDEWIKTGVIRSNITLDRYIVMPDHFHGIIMIDGRDLNTREETPQRGVSTRGGWRSGCLGAVINQFKTACTKRIRADGYLHFAWQPRFHDRVIRDEREMMRIRAYILRNAQNWDRRRT